MIGCLHGMMEIDCGLMLDDEGGQINLLWAIYFFII
jgi:hypothetical protein